MAASSGLPKEINMSVYKRRTKEELALRVAQDIPEGAYVNLGIGQPTLVANFIPEEREVILQSENGILGMGPAPMAGDEDFDLINAGKQPVTLLKGGAFFHHADSFAMMRGGHLDICVLGAFQVSEKGDLATKKGESKVVSTCSYPLTGIGCVSRIYSDLATLSCGPDGLGLIDIIDGLDVSTLSELIGVSVNAKYIQDYI